jgi:lipoprotein-anchoring transpeptidase ErfK/SrfK
VTQVKAVRVTVVCLLTAGLCAQAARATTTSRPAPRQETVALLSTRPARDSPSVHGRQLALVDATRPITGERTVLPVLRWTLDRHGRAWLLVRLPGRTLGATAPPLPAGWISASNTLLSTTPWHIAVDLGARKVTVSRDGRPVHSYPAIVGKPSTPTPTGQYLVEENIRLSAGQPGGPFALATSDRSNVLQEFDGGPGQIALHGLDNLGGQLGTAESHGCIRLADSAIAWLAARIGPGVSITITA